MIMASAGRNKSQWFGEADKPPAWIPLDCPFTQVCAYGPGLSDFAPFVLALMAKLQRLAERDGYYWFGCRDFWPGSILRILLLS